MGKNRKASAQACVHPFDDSSSSKQMPTIFALTPILLVVLVAYQKESQKLHIRQHSVHVQCTTYHVL